MNRLNHMIRLFPLMAVLALALPACGGTTQRLELRSSEQLRISQLLGCNDYNIDEADGAREGATTRRYLAACVEGDRSGTFLCTDGGTCEEE